MIVDCLGLLEVRSRLIMAMMEEHMEALESWRTVRSTRTINPHLAHRRTRNQWYQLLAFANRLLTMPFQILGYWSFQPEFQHEARHPAAHHIWLTVLVPKERRDKMRVDGHHPLQVFKDQEERAYCAVPRGYYAASFDSHK